MISEAGKHFHTFCSHEIQLQHRQHAAAVRLGRNRAVRKHQFITNAFAYFVELTVEQPHDRMIKVNKLNKILYFNPQIVPMFDMRQFMRNHRFYGRGIGLFKHDLWHVNNRFEDAECER